MKKSGRSGSYMEWARTQYLDFDPFYLVPLSFKAGQQIVDRHSNISNTISYPNIGIIAICHDARVDVLLPILFQKSREYISKPVGLFCTSSLFIHRAWCSKRVPTMASKSMQCNDTSSKSIRLAYALFKTWFAALGGKWNRSSTYSMSGFAVSGLTEEWSVVRSRKLGSKVMVSAPPFSALNRLLGSSSLRAFWAVLDEENETVVRFVMRLACPHIGPTDSTIWRPCLRLIRSVKNCLTSLCSVLGGKPATRSVCWVDSILGRSDCREGCGCKIDLYSEDQAGASKTKTVKIKIKGSFTTIRTYNIQ